MDAAKFHVDAGKIFPNINIAEVVEMLEKPSFLQLLLFCFQNACIKDGVGIDPCMGSGHILVYAFDVLMQIYESQGYTQRDAAQSILQNNLYGLDIDERAAQLAYFAVMMKARQYDRRIFSRGIQPHVYAIVESNGLSGSWTKDNPEMRKLFDVMRNAKEYGSILTIPVMEFDALRQSALSKVSCIDQFDLESSALQEQLPQTLTLIDVAEVLSGTYQVTITNPPYLGLRSIGGKLLSYLQSNFPNSKNDLFSVFIERALSLTEQNGKTSLVTAESWLSLSSFEAIRKQLLETTTIENMLHLGQDAFDAGFGTASFVLTKAHINGYIGKYFKLNEIENAEKKKNLIENQVATYEYEASQDTFSFVPGWAISYWVSSKIFDTFSKYTPLGDIAEPRQGLTTCDNNRFMRFWYEVGIDNISFCCTSTDESERLPQKWYPYNKGGEPRKWYGNNDYVVNWHNDGAEIKRFVAEKYVSYTRTVKNIPYYFKKGLTWSAIAKRFAVRAYDTGFIFADKGQAVFATDGQYYYLCALMNSKYTDAILAIISPTLDFNCGYIKKVPVAYDDTYLSQINELVKGNIKLSKQEWDDFETSWNFARHPLARSFSTLSAAFDVWQDGCAARFARLKANEEELNRIFIGIYGLQDELPPDVDDKDVTVRLADKTRDVKSLLSYAVGCLFGRYSLDVDGLAYAGGEWDTSKYSKFIPDADNVIPITDEEYLEDDIISRLCQWLKVVYGEDTLEQNLDFIASALGNKGDTSREVIRNYFLKDFFKDHCQIYQKRPIYWLFDSGKQNGFKALIYLHRYNADTIGNLRIDYLHRMQRVYESETNRMQDTIDHSSNAREVAQATKRKEKLQKQLKECREYDEKISHLALARIELDLDDGVKVNYEKVQTARDGKKYQVLAKI